MMQRTAAAVLIAVLAPAVALHGWGRKGHRIVAEIAQERLTEVAKRNVQSLIGNNTLASVANWADEIRPERDETYDWHFVDIPKDAKGFSDARDCYRPEDKHRGAQDDHQNCVVDRIEYFQRVLGMHRNTLTRTASALRLDVRALRPGSRRLPRSERLVTVATRVSR